MGHMMRSRHSDSSLAFNIGVSAASSLKCSIHSFGTGSGMAPAGIGVMWYRFIVSHPVRASNSSTFCWMKSPSTLSKKPRPALGSSSICRASRDESAWRIGQGGRRVKGRRRYRGGRGLLEAWMGSHLLRVGGLHTPLQATLLVVRMLLLLLLLLLLLTVDELRVA